MSTFFCTSKGRCKQRDTSRNHDFSQYEILSLVFQMKSLGGFREIQRSPYFMSMIAEVLISGLLTIITLTESINKLSNVLPCTVYLWDTCIHHLGVLSVYLSIRYMYISFGCFVCVWDICIYHLDVLSVYLSMRYMYISFGCFVCLWDACIYDI